MAETPKFNIDKLLEQAGLAAQSQHFQMRGQLLRHLQAAVKSELGIKDGFNGVEYPAADLARGALLFKPGQKLTRHIWGTIASRTEPWEPGAAADIGFFVGRDLVLVVCERDDTPRGRERFIVHINGFVEHLQ